MRSSILLLAFLFSTSLYGQNIFIEKGLTSDGTETPLPDIEQLYIVADVLVDDFIHTEDWMDDNYSRAQRLWDRGEYYNAFEKDLYKRHGVNSYSDVHATFQYLMIKYYRLLEQADYPNKTAVSIVKIAAIAISNMERGYRYGVHSEKLLQGPTNTTY